MKKTREIALQLIGIRKKYEIHHEKPTLVEKFTQKRNETFWALQDINLTIYNGERVGIIGHNGSGKTTLLKIITGITAPTQGRVVRNGRIISLIDLEAGFHLDLTGEQNIYLQGMLLGIPKKIIKERIAQIISFADLGAFIDTPLFTYSQGMRLRLGFAVAIHSDPDILVLDEGITTGDIKFQEKSQKKLDEFVRMGKTVLVSTQWLLFIKSYCSKVVYMKKGKIIKVGGVEVADIYKKAR
jgi:ABC-type polysaccharide/polyol phosphate transport system ATPase subunit